MPAIDKECALPTCDRPARGTYCVAHAARIRLDIPMDKPLRPRHSAGQWVALIADVGALRSTGLSYELIGKKLSISQSTAAKAGKAAGFTGTVRRPAKHGTPTQWMSGCHCSTCTKAKRDYKSAWRAAARQAAIMALEAGDHKPGRLCPCPDCLAKVAATLAERLERTRRGATAHQQRWTDGDMETAMRDDLRIENLAAMLGRTYAAIDNKRRQIIRIRAQESHPNP